MADLSITAANVAYTSGPVERAYNAGATITAGQAVYLDSATSTWKLAQCDGTAAEVDAVGIALHAALTGQPLAVAKAGAVINIGATTATNVPYMVSATAGGVAPLADLDAGKRICYLGFSPGTSGVFHVICKNMAATVA